MAGWGIQEQAGWRKGPWTTEEDKLLTEYVAVHGEGRWSTVARSAGLNRSGKSCRLRWVNYLRPGLKRGHLTPQEESIIIELHALWGNKWSMIARCLPGRTDNEIKNYWRTHFKNKTKTEKRPRIRALRQQKQLQQQEQKRLQQQQFIQQQQQQEVVDVQAECDYPVSSAQARQEMVLMYPNIEEQQCFPAMFQEGISMSDFIGEEGLWGSLWNLDDPQSQFNQNYDPNKFSMQNQHANNISGGQFIK